MTDNQIPEAQPLDDAAVGFSQPLCTCLKMGTVLARSISKPCPVHPPDDDAEEMILSG